MKILIYLLVALSFSGCIGTGLKKTASNDCNIILAGYDITYKTPEEFMERKIPIIVRNSGNERIHKIDFIADMVLHLDDKEYDYALQGIGSSGPAYIKAKSSLGTELDLTDYDIPKDSLTPGKHSIAVSYGNVKSNTLVIIIEGHR